jgi:hypothetical protein
VIDIDAEALYAMASHQRSDGIMAVVHDFLRGLHGAFSRSSTELEKADHRSDR